MANLIVKDGAGATVQIQAIGDGSAGDPFVINRQDLNLGLKAETTATTDVGAFSLIQLFKRLLSLKLPDLVGGRVQADSKYALYGNPTIGATSTLAGISFDVAKYDRLRIQINNGAAALTGFEVATRSHVTGDWQIHLNAPVHFTSPTAGSILRHCADLSGSAIDLTTLAANGKAVMAIDLRDFFGQELRIRASTSTTSTVQIYWGAA